MITEDKKVSLINRREKAGKVRYFFLKRRISDSKIIVRILGGNKVIKNYIMALDQGTTSSRCTIFNRKGELVSKVHQEFQQIYPKPGWVEHNPMEIWHTQISVVAKAMGQIGITSQEIAAIGITNQRETTICWNKKTGIPIYNAIVWQCRRTAADIEILKKEKKINWIYKKTGLIPDAYFSATKIKWILEHVPEARKEAEAGNLLFGTVDTWLIWNLTKGKVFATDYTNASRTMLFDINRMEWSDEILDYFQIPKSMLPQVNPSSSFLGYVDESFLGSAIPITAAAGDQQAALFGQCCFEAGGVKNTYGTGCFLLMNTGNKPVFSTNGLLTTIAADSTGHPPYAIEGSVFIAGAAIQWLRDELGLIKDSKESEDLAKKVEDTNGVYVVPAFTGLGAPYWDPYARGVIAGLTRGVKKEHIVRATLESLAYQTADVLKAMEADSNMRIQCLKVDGGASSNNFLMQFQADILNTMIYRPNCIETTALGAAYLAGLFVSFWESKEELADIWKISNSFTPHMQKADRLTLLKGWKKAVNCTRNWDT